MSDVIRSLREFRKELFIVTVLVFGLFFFGCFLSFKHGISKMTNYAASTDPAVIAFINQENILRPINSPDPFMPAQDENGIAGTNTDNVVGLSSISAGAGQISLGTAFNTVIVQGAHSSTAAASGSPDSFSFNVDGAGLVTLLDNNTGQTQVISGASFLIFKDAATGTDASGNSEFTSMYFIGNANQSEVTELYNAAFGRQPDLGGVEYYANQLKNGMTFQQIATEFMASPEFQTRYGANVTDTQFVNNLYQNVLHRTPAASEVAYYTAALANQAAGAIVNMANPVQWTRQVELLNFTNSPENQADVSGFVINTADGGYADSTLLFSAQTVANQSSTTGYIDTVLINPTSLPSNNYITSENGTVTVGTAAGLGLNPAYNETTISVGGINQTIVLSSTVPKGVGDGSTTIYTDNTGGNYLVAHGGDKFFLYGTNNKISSLAIYGAANPEASYITNSTSLPFVYGMVDGDHIAFLGVTGTGNNTATILNASPANSVSGASQNFTHIIAINVGTTASDTASSMAAAANAVYKVGDVNFVASSAANPTGTAPEGVVFFGADPNGNTVVYGWYNVNNQAGADANNNHLVDANEFCGGLVFVGVAPSAVHASWFN